MCHQCVPGKVVGLHLGKDVYTNEQVVVPMGSDDNGLSRVGIFGPQHRAFRFFTARIMKDVQPPLVVAFLDGSQGILSVRSQWRQCEILPFAVGVPVLAIAEADILAALQLTDFPFDALIFISDTGRITLEMDQQHTIVVS